jgi:hypothetical protein
MKKSLIFFAIVIQFLFYNSGELFAQVPIKGDKTIGVNFGLLNFELSDFEGDVDAFDYTKNLKKTSSPYFGGRYQYRVTEKISLGFDLGFIFSKISYDKSYFSYVFFKRSIFIMANYTYTLFHGFDKYDLYFVLGVGYLNKSYKYETTNPDYHLNIDKPLSPITSRLGFGSNIMLTDDLGLNITFNIIPFGGGLFNFGLQYKF